MRFFESDYVERVTLVDGTEAVIRLVSPEDKELIRAGFAKLSSAARYARFLAQKRELSEDELRYLTEIDGESHFALGAIRESDGEGLGIARFIRLADHSRIAEAAIVVADVAQRQGLGKLLFLRLVAAATERGIATFHCEVLGSNAAMRELIRAVSNDVVVHSSGGVMTIEVPLPNVAPTEEAAAVATETNPLYRLFKLFAENAQGLWARVSRRP